MVRDAYTQASGHITEQTPNFDLNKVQLKCIPVSLSINYCWFRESIRERTLPADVSTEGTIYSSPINNTPPWGTVTPRERRGGGNHFHQILSKESRLKKIAFGQWQAVVIWLGLWNEMYRTVLSITRCRSPWDGFPADKTASCIICSNYKISITLQRLNLCLILKFIVKGDLLCLSWRFSLMCLKGQISPNGNNVIIYSFLCISNLHDFFFLLWKKIYLCIQHKSMGSSVVLKHINLITVATLLFTRDRKFVHLSSKERLHGEKVK